MVGYRGCSRGTTKAAKVLLTPSDQKFMDKHKITPTEKYNKDMCVDTNVALDRWHKKYVNRKADRLTDKFKVPKADK